MFQTIQGRPVYVVDLPTIPELPIYAINEPALPAHNYKTRLADYAVALNEAIRTGVITEPGKYAIEINEADKTWNIYTVNE